MRRALAVAALCASALLAVAHAAPAAELRRLFPLERDVLLDGGGLARLPLPPDVLAATRPDLADLRLFDADGRELPYLIDTGAPRDAARTSVRRREATVLEARRERLDRAGAPPLFRETYVLAAPPPETTPWELVFDVSQPQFVRRLVVEAQAADGSRRALHADAALFRLDHPPAAVLRVALPLTAEAWPQRLVVILEGEEGEYLGPRLAYETAREAAPRATVAVALEQVAYELRDGRTVLEVVRPAGLVPDALRLQTRTRTFARDVGVWDERPGQAAAPLGAATVMRQRGASDDAAREIGLGAARGDRLRLEIDDGDSEPLIDVKVIALVRQPALVFALDDDAPRATLRYGGGRAHAPRYDVAALRPAVHAAEASAAGTPAAPREAHLGPVRDNPDYDGAPPLAFAMRPGASLDARAWTHQRRLNVPAASDGLSRLRLAAEDVATARPDLGDLRVIDAQARQWPYLLQADAARSWEALGVDAPARAGGTSTYRLRLPAAPTTLDELVIDADTGFVDRPFRLRGRTADGAEVVVAAGRLTLRADRPRPLAIGFAPARLTALELEVDDGDEAPLAVRAARARRVTPELFLVAPPGVYTLLLGEPAVDAPRYELDGVRDVVLAVRASGVASGPLQPNPEYSAAARLAADRRGGLLARIALWSALVAAVVVLGIVTLRAVR